MAIPLGNRIRQADLMMVGSLLLILTVLLVPIPTPIIDLLLVLSIGISILIMMLILDIKKPLDFSAFPAMLLLVTLFRLALNVATTRQILLNAFGGNVIQAFGDFVVGGNYAVGIVIFLILTTINFKVITAGSGRIAEVAARFTLDSMPGKQMSIDADLNQGLIDDKEAMRRRDELRREADFYGAMDGASKFVRGDAVATLIITFINIGAGFFIGMIQKGMTAGDAAARFTILTVGDGLVAQIPALIISTAAGVLVTRAADDESLGTELSKQLFLKPKTLMITGGILSAISLLPGLPFLPFILLGGGACGLSRVLMRKAAEKKPGIGEGKDVPEGEARSGPGGRRLEGRKKPEALPSPIANMKNVLAVSPMDLEIGFGLVSLVDRNQGGKLIERISNVRSQIAEETGIVLPPVNVRDNVNLKNTEYCIRIRGLEVTRGTVRPDSVLAIDPHGETKMEGYPAVREPAFGFQAYWIPEAKSEIAKSKGLTVVDCSSVITTHLAAIVKQHAADILTRQDASDLIDQIKEAHPAVVQELIPGKMTVGGVHRVLQGLLKEKVSIRDMTVILETLADHAGRTPDHNLLVEFCRRALGGHITRDHMMLDGTIKAIGLHPNLETLLRKASQGEGGVAGAPVFSPALAHEVLESVRMAVESARKKGVEPVLICSPVIRQQMRMLIQYEMRDTAVLSFAEVPASVQVDILGMIPAPKKVEVEELAGV